MDAHERGVTLRTCKTLGLHKQVITKPNAKNGPAGAIQGKSIQGEASKRKQMQANAGQSNQMQANSSKWTPRSPRKVEPVEMTRSWYL